MSVGNDRIHIALFSSGYCLAKKCYVFPGDSSEKMPFHAVWALITHPILGKILFDTGYSTRFYSATKYFPNRMYRWITPVFHQEETSCLNQLLRMKISPEEINHVVISHFHADHIGGLHDFPGAIIWCSRNGMKHVKNKSNFSSVMHGVLKSMIPGNLLEKAVFPEDLPGKTDVSGLTMWKWHDDIYFVDLPGHFRGQVGLFVKRTNMGDLLLCADAAWSFQSIKRKIYPSKLVSLISDNYHILTQTMDKLHAFNRENPEVRILPTHCYETYKLTWKNLEV